MPCLCQVLISPLFFDSRYFNHHGHTGLSLYRRRPTTEHGHRGFRLSSLGILLSTSAYDKPRPWTHLDALKKLASTIYDEIDMRSNSQSDLLSGDGDSVIRNAEEEVWEPARAFFEERKAKRKGKKETRRVKERRWAGWDAEFSDVRYSYISCRRQPVHACSPRSILHSSCSHRQPHTTQRSILPTFSASLVPRLSRFTNMCSDVVEFSSTRSLRWRRHAYFAKWRLICALMINWIGRQR